MRAINAYLQGWKLTWQHKRMWLLFYGFNLAAALIATIPISGYLSNTLGESLASSKLLDGFNYTLITDLLNQYGEGISILMDQTLLLILVFLIITIFLTGGMLHLFKRQEKFDYKTFWYGCQHYFWRLLRLTIYFLLIQVVLLVLFYFLFLRLTNGFSPFKLESEAQVISVLQVLIPIYLILATLLLMIQDYAKIHMVEKDQSFLFYPFWQSFKITFKNFGSFSLLYLINLISALAAWGLYLILSKSVQSIWLLALIVGQGFVLFRILLNMINLASATMRYQSACLINTGNN
jgi:hypothetical protein